MKKIFLLFMMSSVMAFMSCNKSNNDDPGNVENKPGGDNLPEEVLPAPCQMLYTTVDAKPLSFESADTLALFGASILSNEYVDGGGVLTFEADIDSIGEKAFRGRNELVAVTLPATVTKLGDYAFYDCQALKSVGLPEKLLNIGDYAFEDCIALGGIVIPDSVTFVGEKAFSSCAALDSVVLGKSIKNISDKLFNGCSSLKGVVLPEGVEKIGNFAFADCVAIDSVVIPKSVKSIGQAAFISCEGLKRVCITDLNAWKEIVFETFASPLENEGAKLYLNGVEVVE